MFVTYLFYLSNKFFSVCFVGQNLYLCQINKKKKKKCTKNCVFVVNKLQKQNKNGNFFGNFAILVFFFLLLNRELKTKSFTVFFTVVKFVMEIRKDIILISFFAMRKVFLLMENSIFQFICYTGFHRSTGHPIVFSFSYVNLTNLTSSKLHFSAS